MQIFFGAFEVPEFDVVMHLEHAGSNGSQAHHLDAMFQPQSLLISFSHSSGSSLHSS